MIINFPGFSEQKRDIVKTKKELKFSHIVFHIAHNFRLSIYSKQNFRGEYIYVLIFAGGHQLFFTKYINPEKVSSLLVRLKKVIANFLSGNRSLYYVKIELKEFEKKHVSDYFAVYKMGGLNVP